VRTPFKLIWAFIIGIAGLAAYSSFDQQHGGLSAAGEPSNTSTSAEDVYSSTPDSNESNDRIISFATGVWTFTEPSNLWWRYVIHSDGSFTAQSAMPVQNDWGQIEGKGHIKPITGKFSDTGQRWFGFDVISDDLLGSGPARTDEFIIQQDGTLIELDGAGNMTNKFKHADANPFSK
jgi:hypothetical protein